ncbi:MAG: arsenate reductase [Polyangiales bacterium]|jgi:arsenate reductase
MHWPLQDPDRNDEERTDEERLHDFHVARDQIRARLEVLAALRDVPEGPDPVQFYASIRVPDLPAAARFYSRLLGVALRSPRRRRAGALTDAELCEMPEDKEPVLLVEE